MESGDESEVDDGKRGQSHSRHRAGSKRKNADQELLLLSKRRKLSSQDDWLALRPTKPLRIKFSKAAEVEQIGRRRKVKNRLPEQPRPARPRSFTPIFERRLDCNRYLMSGALPSMQEEYINVKVGTSAFDSCGRSSQYSIANARSSVAPTSRSFSHLSEEPMLLGADGDTFDADQVVIPAVQPLNYPANARPLAEEDEYSVKRSDEGECISNDLESALAHDSKINVQHVKKHGSLHATRSYNSASEEHHGNSAELQLQRKSAASHAHHSRQETRTGQIESGEEIEFDPVPEATSAAIEPGSETSSSGIEDCMWKQIMGIHAQAPSSTSDKALVSSSQHLTVSDDTFQAGLACHQQCDKATAPNIHHPRVHSNDHYLRHEVPGRESPTQGKSSKSERKDIDADGEACWREFIIGSQDGESEDELHLDRKRKRNKRRSVSEHTPSFELDDLGNSDRATQGETAVSISMKSLASTESQNADGLEDENDSIKDVTETSTELLDTRNIHVSCTISQNPKCFKRAPRKGTGKPEGAVRGYKALRDFIQGPNAPRVDSSPSYMS